MLSFQLGAFIDLAYSCFMKKFPVILAVFSLAQLSFAEDRGDVIFEDDFERSESQEKKDEPGNGWGTNSKSRAKGDKQVDLKDGTMRIYISEQADHAVSVTHPFEFTDGAIGLRYMLEKPKDSLGLNFADLKYKAVHAGHLFMVKVSARNVQINDLKTGNMDLKMREARQTDTLTEEQKKLLKTKQVTFPRENKAGQWYDLLVEVEGDKLTVSIDGEEVGSFTSEGMAHPSKRMLRLSVPKDAVVDDLKIWRKK